ncbi:MAG: lysylphosphatidylglycerol synthase transmembrane domain-containing protein [Anaerolineae bacterium]
MMGTRFWARVRRRWLLWLVLIAVLVLLITRRVQFQQLVDTLRLGEWPLILLGIASQVAYYYVYAAVYQAAFDTVEVQSRTRDLVPLVFAAMVVNSVAPAGGVPGAALFVDDAVRRGQSGPRATEGVFLTAAAEVTALLPLLLLGVTFLLSRGAFQVYYGLAAIVYLIYIVLQAAVLLSGLWAPKQLRAVVRGVQWGINRLAARLKRPGPLAEDWVERTTAGLIGASKAIARRPQRLVRALLLALAAQVIDLISVWIFFLAFRQPVSLGVLAAGFSIGYVVAIIIILPNQFGMMEATMILVYTSLGVPAAATILAVLSYLGINGWLPLLVGAIYLRQLRAFGGKR